MKETLVILAAGMGSRYGGLKQIDGVGNHNEPIIEFTIYDAIKTGFKKVVLIIKKENEEAFENDICNHIFMLDINFFKEINDKYGHPEGDMALIRTADQLKRFLAKTNAFLCRYGGDEFAIISACSFEEAGKLRVTLYREFEALNNNDDSPYRISISVGYAPVVGGGMNAVQEALRLADQELYKEKEFMHKAIEQVNELIRRDNKEQITRLT